MKFGGGICLVKGRSCLVRGEFTGVSCLCYCFIEKIFFIALCNKCFFIFQFCIERFLFDHRATHLMAAGTVENYFSILSLFPVIRTGSVRRRVTETSLQ